MRQTSISIVGLLVGFSSVLAADKSGPQVGEKIESFAMRGVLDDEAGKNIDLVKDAGGKPLLICFVHERTRPSVALARQALEAAANRKADGLEVGLVLLSADIPEMEEWVKRVPQVLPRGVPIGISPEGALGPSTYNLNRNVQMTVIIAKDNRVVANIALTQPSPSDDAPKIAAAVESVLSKPAPK